MRRQHNLDPPARRLAFVALALAFAVVVAHFLIALSWATAELAAAPWQDASFLRFYLGLSGSDAVLAALVLLVLLGLTLRAPHSARLVSSVWTLAALTALVSVAASATDLIAATAVAAPARALATTGDGWLVLSQGRLLLLVALLAFQVCAALLLLAAALRADGTPLHGRIGRWLLVLPLAYGVYGGLVTVAATLAGPVQAGAFYPPWTLIVLAPASAYGAAALFVLYGVRRRGAWLALLVVGLIIAVFSLNYVLDYYRGVPLMFVAFFVPLYLSLVALVQLVLAVSGRSVRLSRVGE